MSSISIIVVTYNHARYLPKCLESIFAQTRKPDEILVIDDFSQDNTSQIIKGFLGKVQYIRHQKNLGSVKTYNEGLKKAIGDFLLLVPADDWLASQLIKKEVSILETNSKIGMVYAQNFMVVNGKKKLIIHKPAGKKSYVGRKNDFELLLTQGDFIPFMTAMVRKNVYEDIGLWDENLPYLHDWEIWIRIARYYPIAYIAESLAYNRIHGSNFSTSYNFARGFEKDFAFILKKHLPKKNNTAFLRSRAFHYYFRTLTSISIENNKIRQALKYWVNAIKLEPMSILALNMWKPFYFLLKKQLKIS